METTITKTTTVKQQLTDILLDVTWSKIAKRYFGKSPSWIYNKMNKMNKMNGIDGSGGEGGFAEEEKEQLRNALFDFSERVRRAAENLY
jgi:hypothetical protein